MYVSMCTERSFVQDPMPGRFLLHECLCIFPCEFFDMNKRGGKRGAWTLDLDQNASAELISILTSFQPPDERGCDEVIQWLAALDVSLFSLVDLVLFSMNRCYTRSAPCVMCRCRCVVDSC